jgi:hypothetical protein
MPCNTSYTKFIFGKLFIWTTIWYAFLCALLFAQKNYSCKKWVLHRLAWTLTSPTLDSLWHLVWAFPSIGSTFAVTNNMFLPYPISIPNHILPSRTVTWTCFGKTVIIFAYELRLRYFFWNWVESNFASNQTHPSQVAHGKRPKFGFQGTYLRARMVL